MKASVDNIQGLKNRWDNLSKTINLDTEKSDYWFCIIRDFYQQLWRRYHTLNHIDRFTELGTKYSEDGKIKDYVNCLLTLWFHDIIYVPTRGDNEDVIYTIN